MHARTRWHQNMEILLADIYFIIDNFEPPESQTLLYNIIFFHLYIKDVISKLRHNPPSTKRKPRIRTTRSLYEKSDRDTKKKNRQITNANLIGPLTRSANETCNYHFVVGPIRWSHHDFPTVGLFCFSDFFFGRCWWGIHISVFY